jgi:hypothetical protein
MKLSSSLGQISHRDQTLCVQLNRAGHVTWVRSGFLLVNRLGDGVFWYALMLTLPVWYGPHAWLAVLHMTSVGLVCTFSYKWLKAKTSRPRPFAHNPLILPCAAPLDEFSFPRGILCMRSRSASSRCPTIRSLERWSSPSRCSLRSRARCWDCTTRVMCWPARCSVR